MCNTGSIMLLLAVENVGLVLTLLLTIENSASIMGKYFFKKILKTKSSILITRTNNHYSLSFKCSLLFQCSKAFEAYFTIRTEILILLTAMH